MALGFNLYCSVAPEEMEALERVVAAAREACAPFAGDGDELARRSGQRDELATALDDLDRVRNGSRQGSERRHSLAPWLYEYLERPSPWHPGDPSAAVDATPLTGSR